MGSHFFLTLSSTSYLQFWGSDKCLMSEEHPSLIDMNYRRMEEFSCSMPGRGEWRIHSIPKGDREEDRIFSQRCWLTRGNLQNTSSPEGFLVLVNMMWCGWLKFWASSAARLIWEQGIYEKGVVMWPWTQSTGNLMEKIEGEGAS